jgi:ANTAR domain
MTSKRSRRARVRSGDSANQVDVVAVNPAAATRGSADGGTGIVMSGSIVNGVVGDGTTVSEFVPDNAVVRRTKDGWRVGSDELPDLTCAMILADLLAAENGAAATAPPKPGTESALAEEAGRLRATISQLEHALATRIRVEQAIGVLAERHRIKPREAFEQLRDAARSRGRKVIDIAGDVVASATNPLLQLPDELSRPRSTTRRGMHQPSGA